MSAADSRKAFTEWVNNDDYAKNHRGQYAERNFQPEQLGT